MNAPKSEKPFFAIILTIIFKDKELTTEKDPGIQEIDAMFG